MILARLVFGTINSWSAGATEKSAGAEQTAAVLIDLIFSGIKNP